MNLTLISSINDLQPLFIHRHTWLVLVLETHSKHKGVKEQTHNSMNSDTAWNSDTVRCKSYRNKKNKIFCDISTLQTRYALWHTVSQHTSMLSNNVI